MSKEERIDRLKQSVALLPNEPGVYRFYNSDGVVIYVGKAKNLRKRVSQYFLARSSAEVKSRALVKNIERIEHIVVHSESDALLLENNLIKSLQPKYNILLKDDKSYPWIVVRNEPFPRIMATRNLIKDGSKYYGPYTSITMQRSVLKMVNKLYMLRNCKLPLNEESIAKGKFQNCLEYHLGNCDAPCEGGISQELYNQKIRRAEDILKGELSEAKNYLREQMLKCADELRFEEAQNYKVRLEMLDNYSSKSVIVSPQYSNMDIFSLETHNDSAFCNYLHINRGSVVNSYTLEMKLRLEESLSELLTYAISEIISRLSRTLAREVIVPLLPDVEFFPDSHFTIPQRGDKRKLLELSERNAKSYRLERQKQAELHNPELKSSRVMELMRRELELPCEPRHIECFDNSNIQGEYAVSSCVVFRDGKPAKKDYRHFNIKTVEGIDDFASMRETVFRRYARLMAEEKPLPQLIVVDGGKGQLSSAYDTLKELGIENEVSIIGLAKRLEEVFYPNESEPLILDKMSETLRVLMHIRNEAHRFGITFHRKKRSKGAINSELEAIEGVGKESIKKLFLHFKSVNKIKIANFESLSEVVGKQRAQNIINYFKNEE